MRTAFLFHGTFGDPQEHWFPWLGDALRKKGVTVIAPAFPTPEGQTLSAWLEVFDRHRNDVHADSLFIGHSLGASFILRILETLPLTIDAAFLIAGFAQPVGIERFDALNRTFIDDPFDWNAIRKACRSFTVFQSGNDPYVPLSCAQNVCSRLGVTPVVIPDAGHFNAESGYSTFPELLDMITALPRP